MNKRLLKELIQLTNEQNSKPFLENNFLIYFDDSDISKIYSIIKGPSDSLYKHKFIRLNFDIPDNYPHSPPKVTFVNYDSVRIHPNMYENGQCCATILNTWGSSIYEKWTSSMGIETILVMFHSFLDNAPYVYEPGGKDDPTYSVYVLHQTWTSCLIRYLQYETIEIFKDYISNYLMCNINDIFSDLNELDNEYPNNYYYTPCFEIDNYIINYKNIIYLLSGYYSYIEYKEIVDEPIEFKAFNTNDYKCQICFDTKENETQFQKTICGHNFHISCLKDHCENNNSLCPMCRTDIQLPEENEESEWIINPLTKRKIKVGGKTHIKLINEKLI
jgi:ubiquitin-conjugating enzyme E2 G2